MIDLTIPLTVTRRGKVYYVINLKLPLRTIVVERRFQEFEQLFTDLVRELGIASSDFPYALPKKRINWLHSEDTLVLERKPELERWLYLVIRDSSMNTTAPVADFLRLPVNCKLDALMFKENVDPDNWFDLYRHVKQQVADGDRGAMRVLLHKLEAAATTDQHRQMLAQLKQEVIQAQRDKTDTPAFARASGGLRVLGGQETADTVNLTTAELLQQQKQIHKDQDHEVEQLRQIVARQRQLGQAIGDEVDLQNEMMDQFSEEIDRTKDKLAGARERAKKFT